MLGGFAWTLALGGCLGVVGCGAAVEPANVVLIIIDTLRADKLSCYGAQGPSSPELDALAAEGVRFATVVSQSPWTRPSIGSLLTGHHPRTLGIYKEREDRLAQRFETLGEVFQRHGYTTIGATANPNVNGAYGFDQGFDRYLDSDVLWDWMPTEAGKVSIDERSIRPAPELFDWVLHQVDGAAGAPFYLQVTLMEVHDYLDTRVGARGSVPGRSSDYYYDRSVEQVSRAIGEFVRVLRARSGFERTLFVVCSDHGEGLDDHPAVADSQYHGRLLYRSSLLVPLLLVSTDGRLPARGLVETPVQLLDLGPTVLELAGLPAALGAGRSLLPLIEGEGLRGYPSSFVAETEFRDTHGIALFVAGWSYIENRGAAASRPRELHAHTGPENGSVTDRSKERPDLVRHFAEQLRRFEAVHPRVAPTPRTQGLSAAALEQLRALGYVDDM